MGQGVCQMGLKHQVEWGLSALRSYTHTQVMAVTSFPVINFQQEHMNQRKKQLQRFSGICCYLSVPKSQSRWAMFPPRKLPSNYSVFWTLASPSIWVKDWVHISGSTISTLLLHDKINPKDCQVASPLVIQGFSNCLGLFQLIMANPEYTYMIYIYMLINILHLFIDAD